MLEEPSAEQDSGDEVHVSTLGRPRRRAPSRLRRKRGRRAELQPMIQAEEQGRPRAFPPYLGRSLLAGRQQKPLPPGDLEGAAAAPGRSSPHHEEGRPEESRAEGGLGGTRRCPPDGKAQGSRVVALWGVAPRAASDEEFRTAPIRATGPGLFPLPPGAAGNHRDYGVERRCSAPPPRGAGGPDGPPHGLEGGRTPEGATTKRQGRHEPGLGPAPRSANDQSQWGAFAGEA